MTNFMKFHPGGVELFHADEQTDRKNLILDNQYNV